LEQLRRAKRWAGLVLCSAMSCFAGTGKICEKPQRAPQHQKYEGLVRGYSFSSATFNNYLGLDGAVFHPGAVQQSSATVNLACGFFGSLWASEPITGRSIKPNFGREYDITAGWGGSAGKFNLSGGATYFAVSPIGRVLAGDLLQLDVMVSRSIPIRKKAITPYIWLRDVRPFKDGVPIGGTFVHWGVRGGVQPLPRGATLILDGQVVHDPGAFGFNPGKILRLMGNVSWPTKVPGIAIKLPIIQYSTPLSPTGDGRGPQLQFGVGFSFARSR